MLQRIQKFLKSQTGQGIVEYALILAFVVAIAAVALSGEGGIGDSIRGIFDNTAGQIEQTGTDVSNQGGNS